MVTGACALCLASSCMLDDGMDEAPALSVQLANLSYAIGDGEGCGDKAEILDRWLSEHGDSMENDLKKFRKNCIPGTDYRCMAHQILASGRVEVALAPCLGEETVRDGVDRLNKIAGTAIGH